MTSLRVAWGSAAKLGVSGTIATIYLEIWRQVFQLPFAETWEGTYLFGSVSNVTYWITFIFAVPIFYAVAVRLRQAAKRPEKIPVISPVVIASLLTLASATCKQGTVFGDLSVGKILVEFLGYWFYGSALCFHLWISEF